MDDKETAPYRETRAARISSRIALLLVILQSAILANAMLQHSPALATSWQQMKIDVPELSRIVVSPIYSWLPIILLAPALLKEWLVKNHLTALIINGAHFAILLILGAFYTHWSFAPMAHIIQTLSRR